MLTDVKDKIHTSLKGLWYQSLLSLPLPRDPCCLCLFASQAPIQGIVCLAFVDFHRTIWRYAWVLTSGIYVHLKPGGDYLWSRQKQAGGWVGGGDSNLFRDIPLQVAHSPRWFWRQHSSFAHVNYHLFCGQSVDGTKVSTLIYQKFMGRV